MPSNTITCTYTVDGGAPVNQLLSSNLTPGASWNFTFNLTANLSACGPHVLKVWVTRTGDVNHLNDTLVWTVQNDCPIVPGNVISDVTVCESSNAGTLSLNGWNYGTILYWQSSVDAGSSWTNIANTTASNAYTALTQSTQYRVIIDGGYCPDDTSGYATVTTQAPPVGGTIQGSDSLCENFATGVLNLTGNVGTIVDWEYSTTGSAPWTSLSNTASLYNFTSLNTSHWYRAIVEGGVCPDTYSDTALIYVDPVYPPATLNGSDSLCISSASGTITASGSFGTVLSWEYSTNGGTVWNNLVNTSGTYNYVNLPTTTWYRMITEGGFCPDGISDTATIFVQPLPIPPTVGPSDTLCSNAVAGILNEAGASTPILDWEVSTDNATFSSLGNTTSSYDYGSQTQSSWYRILLDGLLCPNYYSDTAYIQLDTPPTMGTLNQNNTICQFFNDTLYLVGSLADSIIWQQSSDGVSWQTIVGADSMSYATPSLTQTSHYQVILINGVCPALTSNAAIITVTPAPTVSAGSDSTIYLGDSTQLNGTGGITGIWMPGSSLTDSTLTNPIAFPVVTTPYVYFVIDATGCINSDTVLITVLDPVQFEIHNVITANNDTYNDKWIITGIEFFPQTEVHVFNQYGKLLFESSDYQNDWEGTYQGNKLPNGTYYYVVHQGGTTNEFKGTLTILGNE
jgi:gliding motility-associated-like protein